MSLDTTDSFHLAKLVSFGYSKIYYYNDRRLAKFLLCSLFRQKSFRRNCKEVVSPYMKLSFYELGELLAMSSNVHQFRVQGKGLFPVVGQRN